MGRGGGRYGCCPAPPAPCSTVALHLGGPEGASDAAARDQLTAMPFTLPFGGRSRPPRSGASCVTHKPGSRVSGSERIASLVCSRGSGVHDCERRPSLECSHVAAVLRPPETPRNGYRGPLQTALSTANRHRQERPIPYPLRPLLRPPCFLLAQGHPEPLNRIQHVQAGSPRDPSVVGRVMTAPTSERRSFIVEACTPAAPLQ